MRSFLNKHSDVLIALTFIVGLITFLVHDHLRANDGLSQEERIHLQELQADLDRLRPGDMVTIKHPHKTMFETRLVKRLDPSSAAFLSGPAPMSRQGEGRYINWGSKTQVRFLMDDGLVVHHRKDPGWKQLASWYFLQ